MAESRIQPACLECERLRAEVARLQAEVESLRRELVALRGELAKARKHSGNSSKPPSTDIVRTPTKRRPARKRRRGGQPGHPRHERQTFADEDIDHVWEYRYEVCPCCRGALRDAAQEPQRLQQIELPAQPVVVEEHAAIPQWCSRCRQVFRRPLPEALVKAGLVGPRLTALVGWFHGVCHMSYSNIRKFFRDVMGIPISRGLLAKVVRKVSASLDDPYDQLRTLVSGEQRLNVDETGHKDHGRRLWTWCFRAYLYTVFKISPSRGSEVLIEVLGAEFNGILGCDYFSAYRKYMKDFHVSLQFCLAHLIRDYKFLAEHPDPSNRAYGQRLLTHFRRLFSVIHRRDNYQSEANFRKALERARDGLVWEATMGSPPTREAVNLAERFFKHTEEYFRFITTPGIEPTNNLAEQAIRFVAIHRRLTQGTRGATGQRWVERIATVVTTCTQQGRSIFDFLEQAVAAYLSDAEAPSLIPDTS